MKDLRYSMLLDFYASALTEKQQALMEDYYNQDYSLGEIAKASNTSRQAVMDGIKRAEGTLAKMEETLGLYAKYSKTMDALEECLSLNEKGERQALEKKLNFIKTIWEDENGI
ncbi:DNA-binding protein [Clostridia bacterium OttesenSCG-928-F22]|nr:DNA-binding protein [Clostridia bacterium OttesenSCG-928-F22]